MKYGALHFSYNHFDRAASQIERRGYFTVNLGDCMQSIAVRMVLRQLGVPEEDVISVDRDSLRDYDGPAVTLIMNGVFRDRCFPPPPHVRPLFVGFHTDEATIASFVDYFRRFQPIGCRDPHTQSLFEKFGIAAHVTGCLTLSMPRRTETPRPRLLVIYGSGPGALPAEVLSHVPKRLLDVAEFVFQRMPTASNPLSFAECEAAEKYAMGLLDHYRTRASIVLTPLHHAAAPCMALGIPVIVCRKTRDVRFGFLEQLLPIYTPDKFPEIDWDPRPAELDAIRDNLVNYVRTRLVA